MSRKIILSRTDSLGDVVLTLPMAGAVKEAMPGTEVIFLGRDYTEALVKTSRYVDGFISYDRLLSLKESDRVELLREQNAEYFIHVFPRKELAKLAKQAEIAFRIGTSHRIYHWLTCNVRLALGRKNSSLHEAQLNLLLLKPLGIRYRYRRDEIFRLYGMDRIPPLPEKFRKLLSKDFKNVILHPGSRGSAREWGLENFSALVDLLSTGPNRVFITGSAEEKENMGVFLENCGDRVVNLAGEMSLSELIAFIASADALVAASTGPLHIAAALGIRTVGIYPPIRPMDPGRWGPLGENAVHLVRDVDCDDCRKGAVCHCIREITPAQVVAAL